MGKPTIREILTDFDITDPKHELLAERVEAVLEVIGADPEAYEDAKTLAMAVRRALEGER